MADRLTVELVGDGVHLTCFDRRVAGAGWFLTARTAGQLDGWFSLTPRFEQVPRPNLDGDYAPAHLLTESRVVTVNLAVIAQSPEDLHSMQDTVGGLTKRFLRLIVDEDGLVRHADCFVSARPTVSLVSATVMLVVLQLTCPDPLRYLGRGDGLEDWETAVGQWSASAALSGLLFPVFGQAPRDDVASTLTPTLRFTGGTTTNSVVATNRGQAPVWPILEAVGPFDWCEWECAGHLVSWDSPVPEGSTLQINTHSGEIRVGDFYGSQSSLAVDDFFQLPPGDSVVAFQASHSARFRVRWLSAWM